MVRGCRALIKAGRLPVPADATLSGARHSGERPPARGYEMCQAWHSLPRPAPVTLGVYSPYIPSIGLPHPHSDVSRSPLKSESWETHAPILQATAYSNCWAVSAPGAVK